MMNEGDTADEDYLTVEELDALEEWAGDTPRVIGSDWLRKLIHAAREYARARERDGGLEP